MKKFNLPLISDNILMFAVFFMINIILLAPIKQPLFLKLLLCLFITLLFAFLFYLLSKKIQNKTILKKSDEKARKTFIENLEIMADNDVIALLSQLFLSYNITLIKDNSALYFNNFRVFYNFDLRMERCFISKILRENKDNKILLFYNDLSNESEELVKKHSEKIKLCSTSYLYSMLKEKNLLPKFKEEEKTPLKLADKIKNLKKIFTKKRAKTFAVSGASLLIISYLTFYPFYYRLFSLIMLSLSLIFLIFGKREIKSSGIFEEITKL